MGCLALCRRSLWEFHGDSQVNPRMFASPMILFRTGS